MNHKKLPLEPMEAECSPTRPKPGKAREVGIVLYSMFRRSPLEQSKRKRRSSGNPLPGAGPTTLPNVASATPTVTPEKAQRETK